MTCSVCKIFSEYLKNYTWQGLGWNYFFGPTHCSQVFYFKRKQSLSGLVRAPENTQYPCSHPRQAPNPNPKLPSKLIFLLTALSTFLCYKRKCLCLCHLLLAVKMHFMEQEYLLVCEGSRDKKRLKQYQRAKPQDGL